ncbi:hypothetical protein CW304_30710 [Bacillus sp. UFRGS-B20]|nr:hypothetical protein CW304_30710 [Bacillus sp. UFRGS-B20]
MDKSERSNGYIDSKGDISVHQRSSVSCFLSISLPFQANFFSLQTIHHLINDNSAYVSEDMKLS